MFGSRCASTKLCTLALGNTMFSPIKTLSSGLTATLLRDRFAAGHSWAALKQAGNIFKMHSPLVFHMGVPENDVYNGVHTYQVYPQNSQ